MTLPQKINLELLILILIFINAFTRFSFAAETFDPLAIGPGARALGLGKAFSAMAEDSETIFFNPAGLGEIDHFKLASMSANILDDVNYSMISCSYPLGRQTAIGFGYVSNFVSGLDLRDINGNLSARTDFGNNVFLASIGKKFSQKTSAGVSLKYYSSGSADRPNSQGQGWNIDLGILQNDLGWLSLGLVGQNLLSTDTIRYPSGYSEALPLTVKCGAKLQLMGGSFHAAMEAPYELLAALDLELKKNDPQPTLHSGLEFSPCQYFSLRGGFDREDLVFGFSLKFQGLACHYAYTPQARYFSFSYDERGWPIDWPEDATLSKR